jgi:hypothetical protein
MQEGYAGTHSCERRKKKKRKRKKKSKSSTTDESIQEL